MKHNKHTKDNNNLMRLNYVYVSLRAKCVRFYHRLGIELYL